LHCSRSTPVRKGIERSSNGAARIENVVDQQHRAVSEININRGGRRRTNGSKSQIIPIKRNIENTSRNRRVADFFENIGEGLSKRHSPGLQTNNDQTVNILVSFHHFVSHTSHGSLNVAAIKWL
jgi:hypothetical protein